MDIQDPPPALVPQPEERDTAWAEMNERLKALQARYARARLAEEPRSFATRFRD